MIGKLAFYFFGIVVALSPMHALAEDGVLERIQQFMYVLENNPMFSISRDYDRYNEGEMAIAEKLCGPSLALPANERKLCSDLAAAQYANSSTAPSLFLLWLRTKLPGRPVVNIMKIEWEPRCSQYAILAKLDNATVAFSLFDAGDSYHPLDIKSLNGQDIWDILNDDMRNGLSVSRLLK